MDVLSALATCVGWLLVAGMIFLLPYVYDRIAGGNTLCTIETNRKHVCESMGYEWIHTAVDGRVEADEEGSGPRCRLVSWNIAGFSSPWNLSVFVDRLKHQKYV